MGVVRLYHSEVWVGKVGLVSDYFAIGILLCRSPARLKITADISRENNLVL